MSIDAVELQEQSWRAHAEGRLDDAFHLCCEALDLVERNEGANSLDLANLLNDLTEIEFDRANYKAAEALAQRARGIENALRQELSGESAARIRMKTFQLSAAIRRVSGDYPGAEEDARQALAVAVSEFGEASTETAEARNDLAVICKYWGRFDEGLRLYREALDPIVAAHGEVSEAAATIFHNIGGILHARGDSRAAEEPARKAWEISRQLFGAEHRRTLLDATAYAAVFVELGEYRESEAIYRRALAIFEHELGPEHAEVAATLHNLAAALASRGETAEAERCYGRALIIKKKLLGDEAPDVALTCNNLGKLLLDVGRVDEALPLLATAVAILEKHLPADHPHLRVAREHFQGLNVK